MSDTLPGQARLRLIHWNAGEAQARADALRALGFEVQHEGLDFRTLRQLREAPPDAVVIDLTRLPSQGRDIGLGIRYYRDTHDLPLVFLGGEPAKVEGVRKALPDAIYAAWDGAAGAIAQALDNPPEVVTQPRSLLDGYSGTPLPAKLGIKEGSTVLAAGDDAGAVAALSDLPAGARITRDPAEKADLAMWFVRSLAELHEGIASWADRAETLRLWIAWPKKGEALGTDVGQPEVRTAGLAAGLVDFKVARIDERWTALAFTRRKK